MKKATLLLFVLSLTLSATQTDGEKVFREYCWGCHHESAMAFGPSFSSIAAKRTKGEIMAYVISPASLYKSFGYKRTVMTQFHLSNKELNAVSDFVLQQKGK